MEDYFDIQDVIDVGETAAAARAIGQRQLFQQRFDPFDYYSEEEFLETYRLSKQSVNILLQVLGHRLPDSHDRRGLRIAPRQQLLVTLRYLASGGLQLTTADTAEMSQTSASRCIVRVTSALAEIAPLYIKFPEPSEEEAVMKEFSQIAGMPGCIGCIDGILIPIRNPGGMDSELYRCHKDFHAINIMAVCSASLMFTALVGNWPGSAHDSRIFNESVLCHQLQQGHYQGYLLGDSAYPCRRYIQTPISSPSTDKERNYNASHLKTWSCIERAFSILKSRFAVLTTPIRTEMATTHNLIIATFVLHNIAMMSQQPFEESPYQHVSDHQPPSPQDDDDDDDDDDDEAATAGTQKRSEVVEKYF
ncbi:hypothetical protein Pcinc_027669 [Petrolisthes cinctipes]|uniref:Putative nuclease HARBI1 n=1 Tax=Petrolisthes cinctipes TaxID=88211 RepID=A0AAE1F4Q8_PETCI|nr:hypothetical protein Pcinc_027669 [Petrolisthes cinctipes]